MKALVAVHLVQFSFWDYDTFPLSAGGTAFIGPNGAGKTSLVDAIQIALVGGSLRYTEFNSQSVRKDERSIRDYALGTMRSDVGERRVMQRKRDEALSYITLVFADEEASEVVSAGLCLWSTIKEPDHRVMGLYVLPGVRLELEHHLEDVGEEGKAPIAWNVFEAQARRLASAAGRTPTLSADRHRVQDYINELLHNISDPGQSIDPRRFLKALKQSVRLKDVNSVDDFLRENLVDAIKIDRKGTLLHIQTLRRLGKEIEDVERQLGELDALASKFDFIARQHTVCAVARAVSLKLRRDSADAELTSLDDACSRLTNELAELTARAQETQRLADSAFQTHRDLLVDLSNDPDARASHQAHKLYAAMVSARDQARQSVERIELQLFEAVRAASELADLNDAPVLSPLRVTHTAWSARRASGEFATVSQLSETLAYLTDNVALMDAMEGPIRESVVRAQIAKSVAEKRLRSLQNGAVIRDDDAIGMLQLFTEAGIRCHAVSSVVRVRDEDWRRAIETFLARNRFAIIVQPGRERDAIRLLRNSDYSGITVVQPHHLQDAIDQGLEAGSVAELLESDDRMALAYLRRILGKMRCVETEAELEKHPRALTKDCMLSANGGTKRLNPLDDERLAFGVNVTRDDLVFHQREFGTASAIERESKLRLSACVEALERVRSAIRLTSSEDFESAWKTFEDAQDQAAAAERAKSTDLPERTKHLQAQVDAAIQQYYEANSGRQALAEKIATAEEQIAQISAKAQVVQIEFLRLGADYDQACSVLDYDAEHAAKRLEQAEYTAGADAAASLGALRDEESKSRAAIDRSTVAAQVKFVEFINDHVINLVDERSDWRKANLWTRTYGARLRDSTLVDYKQKAADARLAAERAFESDVKFRLREELRRVTREINDLNKILASCPPFTNREQYKFSATLNKQHEALFNLIMNEAGDSATASLLESDDGKSMLVSLMEGAEAGTDRDNNPLEDYRLFYKFDLDILVDSVKVDVLSSRMGVGSNGEHRVPFYVIAGAVLATAYRIKPGQPHRGAGVMILDEAFYGMDAQNTLATADFLKSLGLQLVMAGPDSDTSKLSAVLDDYHELQRFGADVFTYRVIVKELARERLESDMPERNPRLIEQATHQLSLADI